MTKRTLRKSSVLIGLVAAAVIGGNFGLMQWKPQEVLSLENLATGVEKLENKSKVFIPKSREAVPTGFHSYGGSTTMRPIQPVTEPFIHATVPGFRLRYTNVSGQVPGSEMGIKMLLDGQIAFSKSSRPIRPQEQGAAQQRGFELEQIAVAIDGIAIVVNTSLNLEGLTLKQLSDIYQGKITNWSEVGGPNLTIQPFSQTLEASGTSAFFAENVLNGSPFMTNVGIVSDTTTGLREVANAPGGIYYASASEVVSQCMVQTLPLAKTTGEPFVSPYQSPDLAGCPEQRNHLDTEAFKTGTYPLTRQLFVIVKKNASVEEEAGRAYANILLTPEGQALIEEAGFIGIR